MEVRGLSFAFGQITVLENIDVTIDEREAVCLVGPNGGGKTTLLKLILGLLEPDAGSLSVFGKPPGDAFTRVGYMPQQMQFDPLFPITVEEVVRMGLLGSGAFGGSRRIIREAVWKSMEEVGVAGQARQSFGALSGGQRQRVLIARALISNPDLLLLDEPTAMVDAAAEEQLLTQLRQLHDRMTLVIVSHDLGFVSQIVESVICINRTAVRHPTSAVNGAVIRDLYGADRQFVHHSHTHGPAHPAQRVEGGCRHD